MVVGVLRLELLLPENHSLKGKRSVLRTIKARVQNKFNVSIAECEEHDLWQRAVLGARVHVRTLAGPEGGEAALRALRRGAPHLRSVLGRELGLRVTPELRFEYDTMPDQARRLDELLRQGAPPPKSDEEDG